MQQPKIEIKNLFKVFYNRISDNFKETPDTNVITSPQDKIVVDDLSVEFNTGESIGIIGRNGAGKSTLLSMIAGLAKQSSGQIIIKGKVTAVMTLGLGLREDLSGRENIYLDGELQGKTRTEINVLIDEIIEFSELHDFIDKPVKYYSTGMKSRLAFSMLVCIEPEILIIDEALSAGDVFFAEKATKKIKEICAIGKIVIVVSHSMAAIESLCNRCLWIEKGKIVGDGDPKSVTQAYLQKVKDENNSIELNLLQADLSKTENWAKYIIGDVTTSLYGANYLQRVFHTEDFLVIEISIQRSELTDAVLNVCIERIDGIIVSLEEYQLSKPPYSETAPDFVIELSLESLVLNKGFYQLKIDLVENQITSNQFTRFFEVKNEKMATGGVAVLHYPAEIKLINEEISTCSDWKELMVE
jgi:lipopolysaccharide transport system ATP-binding protein